MMSDLHALFGSPWAMHASRIDAVVASLCSRAELVARGLTVRERGAKALAGEPTIEADIVGDTATVPIYGTLLHNAPWWATADGDATDYMHLRQVFGQLAANAAVSTVVMNIDSPGGHAFGLTDTIDSIKAMQAAGKTVIARCSGYCASAAYFIACQADEIQVEADAIVGSIGTYIVQVDTTALQERIGIKMELIASGGVKGHGADGRLTSEGRAAAQTLVDSFASTFRDQVAAGRGLDAAAVTALATGDVWLGRDAVAKGLADRLITTAPAAAAPVIPAAATPSTTEPFQGSTMKINAAIVLAFISALPDFAADISAEAETAENETTLASSVLKRVAAKHATAIKSEQDAHAITKTALATEQTAHAATKTDLQAKVTKLTALGQAGPDSGSNAGSEALAGLTGEARWKAEFDGSPKLQEQFFANSCGMDVARAAYCSAKQDEAKKAATAA